MALAELVGGCDFTIGDFPVELTVFGMTGFLSLVLAQILQFHKLNLNMDCSVIAVPTNILSLPCEKSREKRRGKQDCGPAVPGLAGITGIRMDILALSGYNMDKNK